MSISALAFLLATFGGIVYGLARQPVFALLAYIVAFYANPPSRWWGATLPDLRWALLTGVVGLVAATIHRSKLDPPRTWHADTIFWAYVVFVAYWWVQLPWAVGPEEHIAGAVYMTKYLIVLYVAIRVLDEPRKFEWLMITHVLGCTYLGILARSMSEGSGRLDGVGGPGIDDANTLGMMFATALVVGATQVMYGAKWKRIGVLLCLPVILNGLILTQSRGAFLGLVAGGFFLLLRAPKGGRKVLVSFAALGVVALGVLAHEQFWERIGTITAKEEERDFSAASRLVIMEAQVEMFRDHPLGTGSRGTAALSRDYLPEEYLARDATGQRTDRSSHNMIMTVITEHGVPGTIIYAVLLLAILSRIWRLTGELRDDADHTGIAYVTASVGGVLAVVFVAGQFADYLRAEVQIWMLGTLIAMTHYVRSTKANGAASAPVVAVTPVDAAPRRPHVPTRAMPNATRPRETGR